ncbi:MAG: hypothetical protein BWX95_01112 [Bacteroidetes bacterium ADurb.Bin141]|nr:MAG: hypothetical protein UZ10_BCD003002374 [Bacteroidetes bacterium OLB10]MBV6453019.1 hypothetical protein [Bacteroidia bacterium]MBX3105847.1 hypothetical protein [Bacteroidota bacterium]OQB63184.1 MAG: hypothetical protein BWX95_01112 [Bacteroidetes bacterium ADurb.Bin141]MCB8929757.1 hypothetical protein [Bacteroidia bacterium]
MQTLFSKLFSQLGVEVKRVKPGKNYAKTLKPFNVEFTGVPGVGKTSLYKQCNIRDKWINTGDFFLTLKKEPKYISDDSVFYHELAAQKLNSVTHYDYAGADKLRVLSYFYKTLLSDYKVHTLNKEYIVVSDEGLLHNFGREIRQLMHNRNELHSDNFKNRAVIFCNSSAERVAKQILKREQETNRILPQHKNKSFDELVALQHTALREYADYMKMLAETGVKVLEINNTDAPDNNSKKIHTFLNSLKS